jgi:transposase
LAYVPVDRDQLFLVPPSVRDWLPEGHLVWFVLEVVGRLDLSALHARHPNAGPGRRAYDPEMLLGLLVYAYCTGQRSSRKIERLCEVDVAYRVICANRIPDHTTIARFRQDHQAVAVSMFTDVLVLCAAAGLTNLGVVAVDGTKMGANASLKANRTRSQIEAEVAAMFAEAAAADDADDRLFGDDRGDELPAELADPRTRGARLDAALRELEAQEAARRTAEAAARAARAAAEADAAARGHAAKGRKPRSADPVGDAEADLEAALTAETQRLADFRARRAAARAAGKPDPPRPSQSRSRRARIRLERMKANPPPPPPAPPPARVNTTDPETRVMKTAGGWVQGYNAQAAVNDQGVTLAAVVTQDHSDVEQCIPMMAATQANLDAAHISEPLGTMLFDAGYCSTDNITAAGPERLIATTKTWKLRQTAKRDGFAQGVPPEDATPIEAMEHRLRTEAGAALYRLRQSTVEPVFGNIKDNRGFRRFTRRGLAAADAEWKLICAANNIAKMFRVGATLPVTT